MDHDDLLNNPSNLNRYAYHFTRVTLHNVLRAVLELCKQANTEVIGYVTWDESRADREEYGARLHLGIVPEGKGPEEAEFIWTPGFRLTPVTSDGGVGMTDTELQADFIGHIVEKLGLMTTKKANSLQANLAFLLLTKPDDPALILRKEILQPMLAKQLQDKEYMTAAKMTSVFTGFVGNICLEPDFIVSLEKKPECFGKFECVSKPFDFPQCKGLHKVFCKEHHGDRDTFLKLKSKQPTKFSMCIHAGLCSSSQTT